jgi:hypothetical protein
MQRLLESDARIMKQLLSLAFMVMSITGQVAAQDWDKYESRTLKEITTRLAEASFKNPDVTITDTKGGSITLSGNTFPSKVVAVYTGSSRKVSDKKKEVIAAWLRVFGKPAEYLDLFESEYLFTEDGKEYWLPVQKQVASFFEKELRKSDKVSLYVVWIGARRDSNGAEHVFLVNEFERMIAAARFEANDSFPGWAQSETFKIRDQSTVFDLEVNIDRCNDEGQTCYRFFVIQRLSVQRTVEEAR